MDGSRFSKTGRHLLCDRRALAFNDPVDMAAKLFNVLKFRVEIEEVQHPDGRVLVFHIPSRPLGTAYRIASLVA